MYNQKTLTQMYSQCHQVDMGLVQQKPYLGTEQNGKTNIDMDELSLLGLCLRMMQMIKPNANVTITVQAPYGMPVDTHNIIARDWMTCAN